MNPVGLGSGATEGQLCAWAMMWAHAAEFTPRVFRVHHCLTALITQPGWPPAHMHATAFFCQFIITLPKTNPWRLLLHQPFFSHALSDFAGTQTRTHTHTLRAWRKKAVFELNKECDPQWRDYRTPTKTSFQCLRSRAFTADPEVWMCAECLCFCESKSRCV